jgi:ArsR family transcriptional regulator
MEQAGYTERDEELLCQCEDVHDEAVKRARESMPGENETADLADFFKVFGDSTRMRILFALDAGEMCVCDLSCAVGMTKSAVSHQLRSLRQSDLVASRRVGKNIFYSLADEHVRVIIEMAREHLTEKT